MSPAALLLALAASASAAPMPGSAASAPFDPFRLQVAVIGHFESTLAGAPPGPAGAGSRERRLNGRDSSGRPCEAWVDLRPTAQVHGRPERGYPEGSRILAVQVAIAGRGMDGAAYAGSAVFPPAATRGDGPLGSAPASMRPVATAVDEDEIMHVETDGFTQRHTRLVFRRGRLDELRQDSRELATGLVRSFDCKGLSR